MATFGMKRFGIATETIPWTPDRRSLLCLKNEGGVFESMEPADFGGAPKQIPASTQSSCNSISQVTAGDSSGAAARQPGTQHCSGM